MIRFRQSSVGNRALKRVQVPQDLVGAMLFLASPLSDFHHRSKQLMSMAAFSFL